MRRRDFERSVSEPSAVRRAIGKRRLGIGPKRGNVRRERRTILYSPRHSEVQPRIDHLARGRHLRVLRARAGLARLPVGKGKAQDEFQAVEHGRLLRRGD
jgi:hypothetical protein